LALLAMGRGGSSSGRFSGASVVGIWWKDELDCWYEWSKLGAKDCEGRLADELDAGESSSEEDGVGEGVTR
jgi:hypothetical protein